MGENNNLKKAISGLRLRVCEVVPGPFNNRVFRFDFVGPNDDKRMPNDPLVVGGFAISFANDDTLKDFANNLRGMADNLDKYWEKAFPGACSASIPNDESKEDH